MTVGLSAVNLANKWLDMVGSGSAFVAPTNTFCEIHTADPGATGVNAVAGSTAATRPNIDFAAASAGAIALTGTAPSWACDTTETITHISIWDANSAGNFLFSVALTASKAVSDGDTLTLTTCGLALTPIAA